MYTYQIISIFFTQYSCFSGDQLHRDFGHHRHSLQLQQHGQRLDADTLHWPRPYRTRKSRFKVNNKKISNVLIFFSLVSNGSLREFSHSLFLCEKYVQPLSLSVEVHIPLNYYYKTHRFLKLRFYLLCLINPIVHVQQFQLKCLIVKSINICKGIFILYSISASSISCLMSMIDIKVRPGTSWSTRPFRQANFADDLYSIQRDFIVY